MQIYASLSSSPRNRAIIDEHRAIVTQHRAKVTPNRAIIRQDRDNPDNNRALRGKDRAIHPNPSPLPTSKSRTTSLLNWLYGFYLVNRTVLPTLDLSPRLLDRYSPASRLLYRKRPPAGSSGIRCAILLLHATPFLYVLRGIEDDRLSSV